MAGYVFAIGNNNDTLEVIRECAIKGVYSTLVSSLSANPFEGTLTDYISMKPGDNIYFFCKRKYYGIGEIINVGLDCKYCNYHGSTLLRNYEYEDIENEILINYGNESNKYRWICTFKGSPFFFEVGIDTDEILKYKPNTFKMLRAFWKVSFIKLGDEENRSLKEIFLLKHQNEIANNIGIFEESAETHESLLTHDLSTYLIDPVDLLSSITVDNRLRHEMALEAAVVYDLCHDRLDLLGHWDYISHQVIASPFKPIDYMDKIDVFASRYLINTNIPCKYLVAELKKDNAGRETINQVLKYVDWVCSEYTFGNYDAIQACIIAAEFDQDIFQYFDTVVKRYFTVGSHPVINKEWHDIKLIKYYSEDGHIIYSDETP